MKTKLVLIIIVILCIFPTVVRADFQKCDLSKTEWETVIDEYEFRYANPKDLDVDLLIYIYRNELCNTTFQDLTEDHLFSIAGSSEDPIFNCRWVKRDSAIYQNEIYALRAMGCGELAVAVWMDIYLNELCYEDGKAIAKPCILSAVMVETDKYLWENFVEEADFAVAELVKVRMQENDLAPMREFMFTERPAVAREDGMDEKTDVESDAKIEEKEDDEEDEDDGCGPSAVLILFCVYFFGIYLRRKD